MLGVGPSYSLWFKQYLIGAATTRNLLLLSSSLFSSPPRARTRTGATPRVNMLYAVTPAISRPLPWRGLAHSPYSLLAVGKTPYVFGSGLRSASCCVRTLTGYLLQRAWLFSYGNRVVAINLNCLATATQPIYILFWTSAWAKL